MIFSKIHSFSKPVPLPPVRKWQTDLPETRKCAVSPTKIFTNSLFGLCMHWIGSGSKQHKKRRGKLVLMGPSDAAAKVNRSLSAAEGYVAKYAAKEDTKVNRSLSGREMLNWPSLQSFPARDKKSLHDGGRGKRARRGARGGQNARREAGVRVV